MKNNLEEKIRTLAKISVESVSKLYNLSYTHYPLLTNYLSSAIGTVGGDAIAKQFTENPIIKPRDIIFTASAAIGYSYLAPKMIEWSTKITDKIGQSESWSHLIKGSLAHNIFNASVLTGLYFPVNMLYWNYLTIKNQATITLEDNLIGAITLGVATIPYLIADYIAIKKFSQSNTQKYLRPFYSGIEIIWNTLFAGGNYLAKRM